VVKKILIADYEADILKSVSFRLRKSGYEVLTAEDGGTAIEIVRSHKPDLVLLDLRMPVKDGFEVCRDIKSDDELKKIPVIFLTASSGSATDETASAHGAEGFILKPFEALTLIGKIKSLIG
jgi:two-component system, OmpR family, alkaline phosphatase synthesis response regulator PhoP